MKLKLYWNEFLFCVICRLWEIAEKRMTSLLLHSDFIFRFTKLHAEQVNVIEDISNIGRRILNYAHNIRVTHLSNQSEQIDACVASSKSMILIDKLLEMEQQGLIDRPRMIDQLKTFIVAVSGG